MNTLMKLHKEVIVIIIERETETTIIVVAFGSGFDQYHSIKSPLSTVISLIISDQQSLLYLLSLQYVISLDYFVDNRTSRDWSVFNTNAIPSSIHDGAAPSEALAERVAARNGATVGRADSAASLLRGVVDRIVNIMGRRSEEVEEGSADRI